MFKNGFWLIAAALSGLMPSGHAAEFTINPLQISLDRTSRASEISVRNDANATLRMQVQAMSWRQDAAGQDQYEPAEGLLYFPRAMEISAGDTRIIRVGVKATPTTREETYRVFVEELPPANQANAGPPGGASLQVLLRVGVPVFVVPLQPERKAEITELTLRGATAAWVLANTGNVHLRAEKVALAGVARDGSTLFEQVFQERYFLAGVVKTLRFDIPLEKCVQLAALEASVQAENLELKRKLDVAPGSCR
jgi:fimbrial chaperone protein